MCDYCTKHGHGRKWYLNVRNYAKKLARDNPNKDFSMDYFARDIQPGTGKYQTPKEVPTQEEISSVDQRYQKYLHHQIINLEEALTILQLADNRTEEHEKTVVMFPCVCRYVTYGSDPGRHCFGIAFTYEYTKRFPNYLGGGHRYVSGEEARELLQEMAQKENVVHAVSTLAVPYLGLLCNCDMKVCQPYLRRVRLGITSPIYKAHYRAQVNAQKCNGCGDCESTCPFKVVRINPDSNLAEIARDLCYGCGLCERSCPEEAIKLTVADSSMGY